MTGKKQVNSLKVETIYVDFTSIQNLSDQMGFCTRGSAGRNLSAEPRTSLFKLKFGVRIYFGKTILL